MSKGQVDSVPSVSKKYIEKVDEAIGHIDSRLDRKYRKAIARFQRIENRLYKKMAQGDSVKATRLKSGSNTKYAQLSKTLEKAPSSFQQYIPTLDSFKTSLEFLYLSRYGGKIPAEFNKAQLVTNKVEGLKVKFQKAEVISRFLNERKNYLKKEFHSGKFARALKKANKEAFYFHGSIQELRETLSDRKRILKKGLHEVGKSKLFRDFMSCNSQLAGLFMMPGEQSEASAALRPGLQTKALVNGLIQQQLGGGVQSFSVQDFPEARQRLHESRTQLVKLGNNLSHESFQNATEGFKLNSQRVKNFWKRLETGVNVQSQRGSAFLPVSTDVGINVGYRLNDKRVVGVGASYRIGWGENLRKISLSHQGLGLRTFIDWKLKRGFWISGGYEWNYRPALSSVDLITTSGFPVSIKPWQYSGLIGITKKLEAPKGFKRARLQLYWDLLSYKQRPVTSPLVFRVGYGL